MKFTHKTITSLQKLSPALLLLLLLLLPPTLAFWSYGKIDETAEARKHTFVVMKKANDLMSKVVDAETAQRGYLLTNDEAFLEQYFAVKDSIPLHLKELRQITFISASQKRLVALAPLVDSKLAGIAYKIELYRNNDTATALAYVRSGQGKQLMDAIRAEINEFINIEEDALVQREAAFQASMHFLFKVIIFASVIALLLACAFAYLIYRETQQRFKNIAHIQTLHLLEIQSAANKQLQKAMNAAEKANQAKTDFLSKMSHELRTPMNAILGFAQLLETGKPPPTASQMVKLHQILKAGWYLLELINEILELAAIESGNLKLSLESVSLIDVVRECQTMIEPQAQKSGIHINVLPFDHSWCVHADRTRVKQALINLLSNAIKYNREQGTVEVKCTKSTPDRIRISVKDNGAELPPEKLDQLFQPFTRLGQENGTEDGTGIGLAVTKQLVELMEGTVGVESTVGVGSGFWFELVLDVAPQFVAEKTLPAQVDLTANPGRS